MDSLIVASLKCGLAIGQDNSLNAKLDSVKFNVKCLWNATAFVKPFGFENNWSFENNWNGIFKLCKTFMRSLKIKQCV